MDEWLFDWMDKHMSGRYIVTTRGVIERGGA